MKHNKIVYFDYMATTPVDPAVIARMLEYMGPEAEFGNPASTTHRFGLTAAKAVDRAREQIVSVVGAPSAESVIFTSGATEATNIALLGAARFYQAKGRHLITMSTEHKAVLDTMKELEREGFEVSYLSPKPDGLLDLSVLEKALREDTILVSVMQVNNEIGVIQDIHAIGALLQRKGIIFHVDAAQSVGKVAINLAQLNVDLMSLSAHKAYGPKGIGALYIRQQPRIRLTPINFGGGQENGLRSGTLPTHQIVGMGEAYILAEAMREKEQLRLHSLAKRLWTGIKPLPGIQLNGHAKLRVANNLNLSFAGINGLDLLPAMHELAVSTTSACMSVRGQGSYVLRALGLSQDLILSAVRLSLGRYTTEEEVDFAIEIITKAIGRLLEKRQ